MEKKKNDTEDKNNRLVRFYKTISYIYITISM